MIAQLAPPPTQHSKKPFSISDKVIGRGTTGTVRLAQLANHPGRAAVKIVDKTSQPAQEVVREIQFLRMLTHKNIIRTMHFDEDKRYLYIFMEYLDRGDLYSFVNKHGPLPEVDARTYFRQMAEALQYCHSLRVCHHDFKLENCVINCRDELRVIDFGYAMRVPHGETIRRFPGSPAYSPEEVLFRRPHSMNVDIFALGTSLYYMLCCCFPFCDPEKDSFEDLCRNVFNFKLTFPASMSAEAQDLIRKLLQRADRRIDWNGIWSHPWLSSQIPAPKPRSELINSDSSAGVKRPAPDVSSRAAALRAEQCRLRSSMHVIGTPPPKCSVKLSQPNMSAARASTFRVGPSAVPRKAFGAPAQAPGKSCKLGSVVRQVDPCNREPCLVTESKAAPES